MMFIEYENDDLPFQNLPYAFKSRLIDLAPLNDAFKMSIACPEMKTLRRRRRRFYNHIYITDDKRIRNIAMKESCEKLDFQWLRYLADGPFTIDPTWQTVLLVDDIVDGKRSVYVEDTLILCFTSTESFDKLMPFIVGSYSRLVLHGQFTWAQVKNLIHENVKQVRIMNKIEVYQKDYNDVVKFVTSFARGFVYKFSFIDDCFPPLLMEKLKSACKDHKTHFLEDRRSLMIHFIHNTYVSAHSVGFIFVVLAYGFSCHQFYNIDAYKHQGTLSPYYVLIYTICFPLQFYLLIITGRELVGSRPLRDAQVLVGI